MRSNDLPPIWRFSAAALQGLHAAATRAHPAEACGALLGRGQHRGEVCRVLRVANAAADPGAAYLIPAEAVRRVESVAARAGLEVVGFFHSHPDGTAAPSARDLAHAWPDYLYVIVPVRPGPAEPTAWRLRDDRSRFVPVAWRPGVAA